MVGVKIGTKPQCGTNRRVSHANCAVTQGIDKAFKYLLVMSKNAEEADNLLKNEFPKKDFNYKLEFLKENFIFNLAARFTLKTDPADIAKEDYFATLQYLISQARNSGIESIIKN